RNEGVKTPKNEQNEAELRSPIQTGKKG
ncbi:MAG: hypothetical protein ACI9WL_000068, partial [Rubritalea sp.]